MGEVQNIDMMERLGLRKSKGRLEEDLQGERSRRETEFAAKLEKFPEVKKFLLREAVSDPRFSSRQQIIQLFAQLGLSVPSTEYRRLAGSKFNSLAELDDKYMTSDRHLIAFHGNLSGLSAIPSKQLSVGHTLDSIINLYRGIPLEKSNGWKPENRLEFLIDTITGGGGGPFLSITPFVDVANEHPGISAGSVYVLSFPIPENNALKDSRIVRNYVSAIYREAEYLVPDIIFPDEIIAELPKNSEALRNLSGIQSSKSSQSKGDLVLSYLNESLPNSQ